MLALGHGAAPGYFDTDALSVITDRISLSIVAVIWVVLLVNRQFRAEARARRNREEPGGHGIRRLLAKTADGGRRPPASWSWMLNPELGLVAFLGRKQEMEVLTAWASRRDAARLRLITGPGGCGKTRLAIELCERGRELGWTSVWVPPGREPEVICGLRFAAINRALIVVDNAETRVDLAALIAAVAAREGDGLRLLMIARSTGEWCRRLRSASPAAHDLVANAMQHRLALPARVQADTSDVQIVAHAVTSIARQFGMSESQVKLRSKKTERYNILELAAAALTATMDDAELAEEGTGTVQANLLGNLDPLLRHEQQFWLDRARHAGLVDGKERKLPLLSGASWPLAACWERRPLMKPPG